MCYVLGPVRNTINKDVHSPVLMQFEVKGNKKTTKYSKW